jgi:ubiquinone/menaquinone biosynthesis C-methylase UbiE
MSNNYVENLAIDEKHFREYLEKSLNKTEQQKFLEELLQPFESYSKKNLKIADIACGGGTLSYHLGNKYENAEFYLADISSLALETARRINSSKKNFYYFQSDIYNLADFSDNSFDLSFCWQTLSWIERPEQALSELIRITKPEGKIFCSSLFNLEHDVDIYSRVIDYTRPSGESGSYAYNTYSALTVDKWLENKNIKKYSLHAFNPQIPFHYNGRGIGTKTVKTDEKTYLQISGGMLMNWAILQIEL